MHELAAPTNMALTLRKLRGDSVAVVVHEVRRLQDHPYAREIVRDAWMDLEATEMPEELVEMSSTALQNKWRGWLAIARTRWLSRIAQGVLKPPYGAEYAGGNAKGATGDRPPLKVLSCAVCGVTVTCNVTDEHDPIGIGQVPVVVRDGAMWCWPCAVVSPELEQEQEQELCRCGHLRSLHKAPRGSCCHENSGAADCLCVAYCATNGKSK